MLTCYNRGCGQDYDPEQNTENSCVFHPGAPFFHDAYKGWSCCKRKCIDFTEFLNMKGCTTSFHSNVKPPEPEKKKEEVTLVEEKPMAKPTIAPMKRPDVDLPLVDITVEVSPSLTSLVFETVQNEVKADEQSNGVIEIGTSCKNSGCQAEYKGPESNNEDCKFHPGCPVFHEGLKFWSCCTKRTTEFSEFLAQKGCSIGKHTWIKLDNENDKADQEGNKLVNCRHDWLQTGKDITIVVYAKKYHPTKSYIKANGVKLNINLFFPEENSYYKKRANFSRGMNFIIDPMNCSAQMLASKVEIRLRKAEPIMWKELDISIDKHNENKKLDDENVPKNVGVIPVELDDL